jgi:hypothetical protein
MYEQNLGHFFELVHRLDKNPDVFSALAASDANFVIRGVVCGHKTALDFVATGLEGHAFLEVAADLLGIHRTPG